MSREEFENIRDWTRDGQRDPEDRGGFQNLRNEADDGMGRDTVKLELTFCSGDLGVLAIF